jgi:exodeoxyribonuclease VII large subunit
VSEGYQAESGAHEEAPLSVSELVSLVGETLASTFADLLVAGEISNFKEAASGHCYLTLSDRESSIDAVIWRNDARRLAFAPAIGDEVLCRGRMGVYSRSGRMQLYVTAMRPIGAGAAQRALEELKRKLASEGLFDADRKRELPFLPRTIGIVTSRAGAALHDVLTTISRRFPCCRVVLAAAVVQGGDAPKSIVAALDLLARFGACDVVIVGRGGGAAEDLAAFNDEGVVRAIAAFPVPTVSAVGHEVDTTLSDLAADRRAATPTAAAELVVPVYMELAESVSSLDSRLHGAASRTVRNARHRVGDTAGRLKDPRLLVASARQRADEALLRLERALGDRHRSSESVWRSLRERLLDTGRGYCAEATRRVGELDERMQGGMSRRRERVSTRFAGLRAKLDALSPLAVLERGFSLVSRSDGSFVRVASELEVGEILDLRFRRGRAKARVVETRKEGENP